MHTKYSPRVFYCGMVNTPVYAAKIGLPLHIGAAANKMVAVVEAMREAGARAYLVSLPVLGHQSTRSYAIASILRAKKCPQFFLPIVANRYLRKIISLVIFAWFCLVKVNKNDHVILYNHTFEFLLGFFILALKGNRPILDIEDAVREDELGWQGFVGRPLFYMYNRFASDRKLIVSQSLAVMLGLQLYCVVYGATKLETKQRDDVCRQHWQSPKLREPIKIHYGGSLCTATGVELFCAAVDLLVGSPPRGACQVHFIVTGFGAVSKISALQKRCKDSSVRVSFLPDLSPREYSEHFHRCFAALNLRIPESNMGGTTFPSKVVEITSNGLLLISTKTSDIPILFDNNNSVLLADATPNALAEAIMSVIADPIGMQKIAMQGQVKAMELFESKSVGTRIVDFILKN